MAKKYECIAAVTVGSGGASSITISSIPSTYTDLCLKLSLRRDTNYTRRILQITFNGVTSGYTDRAIYGNGSSAASNLSLGGGIAIAVVDVPAAQATSNTFSNIELYAPNYTSSDSKSILVDGAGEDNAATTPLLGFTAGLSNITSAISSINLYTDQGGNFVQNSTAYLYGIKNS